MIIDTAGNINSKRTADAFLFVPRTTAQARCPDGPRVSSPSVAVRGTGSVSLLPAFSSASRRGTRTGGTLTAVPPVRVPFLSTGSSALLSVASQNPLPAAPPTIPLGPLSRSLLCGYPCAVCVGSLRRGVVLPPGAADAGEIFRAVRTDGGDTERGTAPRGCRAVDTPGSGWYILKFEQWPNIRSKRASPMSSRHTSSSTVSACGRTSSSATTSSTTNPCSTRRSTPAGGGSA